MRFTLAIAAAVAVALTASVGFSGAAQPPRAAKRVRPPLVSLRLTPLGRVLVGPNGHTLYLHVGDRGARSTCTTACLKIWPVFRSRRIPRAGRGVRRPLFKVYRRTHRFQVAYAGHLLYYFKNDTAPGQLNGEGAAGFYAVSAAGRRVAPTPTVSLRMTTLGQILVGPNGHTLYLDQTDSGSTSSCEGSCLQIWPAFSSSRVPHAGTGVTQSLLKVYPGTHQGQVAYAGHLLYYFRSDTAAGQTSGEGLAGFYAVSAAGTAVLP